MKKLIQCYRMFTSFEGTTFVYALSYSLLLALTPLIALVVLVFRNSNQGLSTILQFLQKYVPSEFITPFVEFFTNNSPSELLPFLFFIGVSFYVASKSIYSFLLISARADEVDFPSWFLRIVSILDFLVLLAMMIGTVWLFHILQIQALIAQILLLFWGFCVFYRLLAFRNYEFRYIIKGAAFTTAALSLLGTFFFFVIDHFTSYQSIYGPLASLVILFLSAYIIASIVYIGFCINQVFEEKDCTRPVKHYGAALQILQKLIPQNLRK